MQEWITKRYSVIYYSLLYSSDFSSEKWIDWFWWEKVWRLRWNQSIDKHLLLFKFLFIYFKTHNGIFITLGYLLWLRPILYSKVWQHQFWADYCEITEAHHHIHIHPVLFSPYTYICCVCCIYTCTQTRPCIIQSPLLMLRVLPPLRRRWMRLIARPCLSLPFFQTYKRMHNGLITFHASTMISLALIWQMRVTFPTSFKLFCCLS